MQSALALAVPGCLSGQALQTLRRNRAGVRGAESCIPTHKRRRNSSCCWTRTSGLSLVMIRTKCPRVSPFATCSCLTPPSRPPRRAQELCLHIDHVCVCVCVCVCVQKRGGDCPTRPTTHSSPLLVLRVYINGICLCILLLASVSFLMIAFVSLNDQQPVWGNDGNETRKQMEHELWYLQTRTNTRTHTHTLSLFLSLSL